MTLIIRHRESFGYGRAALFSRYVRVGGISTVEAWSGPGDIVQWGRGSAPQGFAIRGNSDAAIGMRLSDWGYSRSGSGFGTCIAYNQGAHLGNSRILEWYEVTDIFGHYMRQLALYTNGFGQLVVVRGETFGSSVFGGGTVIGISDNAIPPGENSSTPPYTHIEVIPTIHGSTGTFKVKVEGELWLDLSGLNTKAGGDGCCDIINLVCGTNCTATDWISTNGAGWLGDKRVAFFPAAALGTSGSAGTAVGAASLLLCVNDRGPDDTSHIELDDAALPKAVSFTTDPLPTETTEVLEVSPLVISRKDDSGVNTHTLGLKSGATTDDNSAESFATQTGYITDERPYAQDPHTVADWLVANADAVEVIYKRTT